MSKIQTQYGQPAVYREVTPSLADNQASALGVDRSGNLLVNVAVGGSTPSLPSAPINGQLTVGTSAVALPSNTLVNGVIITALSTNTVSIFVGSSTVTTSGTTGGGELKPGQSISFAVSNTNSIYAISGSASQILSFVGS